MSNIGIIFLNTRNDYDVRLVHRRLPCGSKPCAYFNLETEELHSFVSNETNEIKKMLETLCLCLMSGDKEGSSSEVWDFKAAQNLKKNLKNLKIFDDFGQRIENSLL